LAFYFHIVITVLLNTVRVVSGLLLLGAREHQQYKSGGNLEL